MESDVNKGVGTSFPKGRKNFGVNHRVRNLSPMSRPADERNGSLIVGLVWLTVFPAFLFFGGSTAIWTWGPGLAALGLAGLLSLRSSGARRFQPPLHLLGMLLLAAWISTRAAFSPSIPAAGHDTALALTAVVACAAGRLLPARLHLFLTSGLAIALTASFASFVVQRVIPEWNPVYPARPAGFPAGPFAHYNLAANFHIGAAGFFLAHAARSPRWRIVNVLAFILAAACVVLSLSRSGILALFLAVSLGVVLFMIRSSEQRWHGIIVLAAFVAAVFAVPPVIKDVMGNVASGRGAEEKHAFDDGGRLPFWHAAFQLAAERPVLGHGSDSFHREAYRVLEAKPYSSREPSKAHNEMLQILVDYGAVAFAALFLLLAVPIVRTIASDSLGSGEPGRVWEAVGLIGMIIQANFDSAFHSAPNVMMAALLLGRLTRPVERDGSGADPFKPSASMVRRCERLRRSMQRSEPSPNLHLCLAVVQAQAYLAGNHAARTSIVRHLLKSGKPRWSREALMLARYINAEHSTAIAEMATVVATEGAREVAALGLGRWLPSRSIASAMFSVMLSIILVLLSSAVLVAGSKLTLDLKALWKPLYQPQGLSAAATASSLLRIAESNPFLGTDRETLRTVLKTIMVFETHEGRRTYSAAYLPRLLNAIGKAETDAGVALQMAAIAGWAGEHDLAFQFHDHAEAIQAGHESVFMAHYFRAEYLAELAESAWRDNQIIFARADAKEAIVHLQESIRLCPYPGKDFAANRDTIQAICEEILSGPAP